MPRIAITTSSFAPPDASSHRKLVDAGVEVIENPYGRKLTEAESMALLRDVDGVLAGTSPLNATVLAATPRLCVISRCGIGIDNVDLTVVAERGIALYTTPDAPAQAVAELTMGLMLNGLRRITEADRQIRSGAWKPLRGRLLHGKTVGIVGLGRVGRRLVELLHPYGVTVVATDPVAPADDFAQQYGVQMLDLDRLCDTADILTLHVPYTAATHHLIDAARLRRMKSTALLVNAARGGVVDEHALLEALQQGQIGGAALDAFAQEPYTGPLKALDNVVMTCHMGSAAEESRTQMEEEAVDNLLQGLHEAGLL